MLVGYGSAGVALAVLGRALYVDNVYGTRKMVDKKASYSNVIILVCNWLTLRAGVLREAFANLTCLRAITLARRAGTPHGLLAAPLYMARNGW